MRRFPSTKLPRLILASGSPRRRDLLSRLDLDFTVRPVEVDETPADGEEPWEYVLRLAREKATTEVNDGELVLAADTVVALDGELLGKPRDSGEARAMLERLSGREHLVATGVALFDHDQEGRASGVEQTRVVMASVEDGDIDWYVETTEPMDKAGSYAIQGLGALFVEEIHGNYSNVVGLPLPLLHRLAGELGYDLRWWRDEGAGGGG